MLYQYCVSTMIFKPKRISLKLIWTELFRGKEAVAQKNRVSFLIKLLAEACNFIKKETLAQVFSCEFYKISKNTFSYRTSPVATSGSSCRWQCIWRLGHCKSGSVQEQNPCGFHRRGCGNLTNSTIFKDLIWLMPDCQSYNYSSDFWSLFI